MDKYTVDLDQVLNDFEYSELTDQYSNASSRNTAITAPSPSQNNVTKHSINNVFHSLNEYLNTNISVDNLNQIDNNPLENKENYIDVNILNHKYRDKEKSIRDLNLKTDESLEFKEKVRENNNLGVDKSDISNNDNVENSEGVCIEKSGDLSSNNIEKLENTVIKTEEESYQTDEKVNSNKEIEDKPLVLAQEEDTRPEIKNDNYVEKIENNIIKDDIKVSGGDFYEGPQPELKDVCDAALESPIENDESNTNESNETQQNEEVEPVVKDEVKKVGFSEDLDLDDSEINKLLEELDDEKFDLNEEEKEEPTPIISSADVTEGCENVKTNEEIKGDKFDEEIKIWECTSGKSSSDRHNEGVENLDNSEINVNSVDSKQTNEDLSKNHEVLSDLSSRDTREEEISPESTIVTDEIKNEVATESTKVTNERKEQEQEEEVSKEDAEVAEVLNERNPADMEQEASQDSLTRPQNLPLISERKINLIGDPGSTPYNNVYKEMPRDSDTDYSTSSSPTFSDASTTASTVSVDEIRCGNDDNHLVLTNPIVEQANVTAAIANNSTPAVKVENFACSADDSAAKVDEPASEPSSEAGNPTSEIENPKASEAALSTAASAETNQGDNSGTDRVDLTEDLQGDSGAGHVETIGEGNLNAISIGKQWLGKEAPLWIPDSDAMSCLHCDMKFTVLKRRHHCRACGLVLCSKCCHLRFRLEYLDAEARVCNKCHDILNKDTNSSSGSDLSPDQGNSPSHRPNPNNPLEYCSTVSPLQQVAGSNPNPPAVMVPVGVLKRKGSNKGKSNKSVMFCDGIRPGSDLTNLDNDFDYNNTKTKKSEKVAVAPAKVNRNLPTVDPDTNTFIPSNENSLPPIVTVCKTDISYTDCSNDPTVVDLLKTEQVTFAIHVNLYVHLKIINMSCCINKLAWCFSSEGLINVGQDEVVILLEYIDEEAFVPKDVFSHISNVYNEAVKGTSVKEMGLSLHNTSNFLDSKNHAGFVYIRPTFQCLENVIKPKDPYLIGILIHRWETPWAKLFPLRLILRLGAEYRYYPSPIISTRHRDSVFVEIGHTIINLLADFRNFSYTLPQIRGLIIHMEDKNTTLTIPANRYDQIIKSMNNSSDHILAFAGNFSILADSHLVCIQDTQGNENCYSTHAINIHNKPRKVTGASFIVFNGALKSSSGLTAKSNIVEDGLMIQVLPEHMQQIRDSLRAMRNHTISCGCVNAASDETVNIVWGENDVNFNVGVFSAIDNMPLGGVPSIRVHNGKNHVCINGSRLIRWTEVFIVKSGDENPKSQDPVDVSRVSESIAKAACDALVKYLDLLVANSCQKIGIRATLHVDNVSYLAGSNGSKLPPIYMKSLDDELIPVLHRITTNNLGENAVVLELIFRILNV